jgi:hypothetical protein
MVGVSNGAFPYGGIDLARLYDAEQRVVSHIGGRAPAGMGLVVRSRNDEIVAASQRPYEELRPGRRPVVLTRSPQGPVKKGSSYPREPYAGRFDVLEARGSIKRAGVSFRSTYTFRADRIEIAWRISRTRTDALSAEALFPSWGDGAIRVALKTGEALKLTAAPPTRPLPALAAVDWFFIDGSESGYVVVPGGFPPAAVVRVLSPRAQNSNPRPGPSLMLRLAQPSKWKQIELSVTIAPARTADDAAAFVAALRGGAAPS